FAEACFLHDLAENGLASARVLPVSNHQELQIGGVADHGTFRNPVLGDRGERSKIASDLDRVAAYLSAQRDAERLRLFHCEAPDCEHSLRVQSRIADENFALEGPVHRKTV